jgi:xanthosine utilization system XapX-like protein
LGEYVPRKRRKKEEKGANVLLLIAYVIVGVVFLKLFRIIPDPPEFDINTVVGLLAIVTTILIGFATWLSKRFSDINDDIDDLEKHVNNLSTSFKVLEERTSNIQQSLNFNERLVKLEESNKEKKK